MCKKRITPQDCYKKIEDIEWSIQCLYESIDNFLFQDIHRHEIQSILPQWIIDGGRSPELTMSKELFERCRQCLDVPIVRKFIYYYDLWSIVAAIQDRLLAVDKFMHDFYGIVPFEIKHCEADYSGAVRNCGREEDEIHISLNSVFVALASTFDLITKLAIEHAQYTKYGDFAKYSRMVSSKNGKYNPSNPQQLIAPSLMMEGMLFYETKEIRMIETFRNEYVHNGPWDLRCSVYYTAVNGEPADVIVFSPDIDETGNFVSSGARNKFYSQANMMNAILPTLAMNVLDTIQRTINQIPELYKTGTKYPPDDAKTKQYIEDIGYRLSKMFEASKAGKLN